MAGSHRNQPARVASKTQVPSAVPRGSFLTPIRVFVCSMPDNEGPIGQEYGPEHQGPWMISEECW